MAEQSKKEQIYNEVGKDSSAVMGSVMFFAMANPLLLKLNNGFKFTESQIARLETNIVSFTVPGAPTSLDEATTPVPEEKESISVAKSAVTASGLSALAFVLPILMNKEAREYIGSFIKGFIGAENLDKITLALKVVTAALAAAFAYKTMQQIMQTLESVKKLGTLTATLFGLTNDGADAVNEKDEDLKKKKKKLKERERKRKASKKKARGAERARRKSNRAAKIKKLKKIKSIKSTISNIKKALLVGGPFGIIAGIVAGIAIGTMIDLVAGPSEETEVAEDKLDEEKDEPEAPVQEDDEEDIDISEEPEEKPDLEPEVAEDNITPEKVGTALTDNALQELSMGFLDLEGAKKALKWAKGKIFGGGDEEEGKEKASPVSQPPSGSMPGEAPPKPSAPSTSSSGSAPGPAPSAGGNKTASQTTSAPSSGEALNKTSSEVSAAKKDQQTGSVVINNVNNSTNVIAGAEKNKATPAPTEFTPIF